MPSYSAEFKEQVVRKLMPPHNQTVAALSRETGISEASLYNWKKQFRAKGFVVPKKSTHADQWDAKAKLAAVIQTAAMNEAERSQYCREHGLYPEQIDAWRDAFESTDMGASANKAELSAERKKSRALEKELHRKEKALAEAAALLTLSKKAQAIWGTNEDD
ncbi:transposase [Pusillimonas sp. CC-YST705]|uniref:Transposase n=1 Tax=Mesopusillimonas faecipullorum TaxID=2755040 RepID=A0ABS8CG88_9BURK|nr:transposase [Mesopusillimonas faecipullorum]MCB5365033.1 transposase [Mesopusillimonas faecipullorum]